MSDRKARARRYVTAAKAEQMRRDAVEFIAPDHLATFNIVTLDWTDWYIVPDDDPRVDTGELLT